MDTTSLYALYLADLKSAWLYSSLESVFFKCFIIYISYPLSSINVILTIPVVDFILLSLMQQNFLKLYINEMKLFPIVF